MRKVMWIMLMGIILLGFSYSEKVYAATDESYFSYEVKEDGTAKITACTAEGDIVIPEKIGGYTVTELGSKIFYGMTGVTTVSIPRTVSTIGMWSYVFSYCYSLTAINVDPDNPAFCSVDGVLYDKNKEVLYNYPCNKADRDYTVPESAEFICCTAFAAARNLKTLRITEKDCTWSTFTFYNVNNLKVYYRPGGESEYCASNHIEGGLTYESNWIYPTYVAWSCEGSEHEVVTGIELVGAYDATCYMEGSTGAWCCTVCGMELIPPVSIPMIEHEYGAWKVMRVATCLYEGEKERVCKVCGKCEYETVPRTDNHDYEDWVIDQKATCDEPGVKYRWCSDCFEIENVEIPATGYVKGAEIVYKRHIYTIKSVKGKKGTVIYKGMEDDIFSSFTIPKKIKSGGYTFTVTEIAKQACKGNKIIESVTIPSTVTKIGQGAFMNCKGMKELVIKSSKLKSVGKNAIKGINKKAIIIVPKKQLKKYKKLFKSKTGYKKTMKIRTKA